MWQSNVEIFRNFLKERNLFMEEIEEEYAIEFVTRERFENGGSVVGVISFNKELNVVEFFVFGLASIKDPLKKESVHRLINEINANSRYSKYIEMEGNISVNYPLFTGDHNIDPENLMALLFTIIDSAEENYSKFMKLQWS